MMSKTIRAKSVEQFRELVPISGIFEMTDCEVEIYYPSFATAQDLEFITKVLESMIHVTDIRTVQNPELDLNDKDKFRVEVHEVKPDSPKFRKRSK
jgi:hypothetical protein